MRRSFYLTAIFILAFCSTVYSQEKKDDGQEHHGMKASAVKELDEFHELLHPLVHEAYPNKDFEAIRKALPKLVESGMLLKKAALPKELASKKKAFTAKAKKLVKQLTELNKKKDTLSDDILGEKFMEMHDTFEELMDLTR